MDNLEEIERYHGEGKDWPLWMSVGLPVMSVGVFLLMLLILYMIPRQEMETDDKPTARLVSGKHGSYKYTFGCTSANCLLHKTVLLFVSPDNRIMEYCYYMC